jgi:hypothetical protein
LYEPLVEASEIERDPEEVTVTPRQNADTILTQYRHNTDTILTPY